MCLKIARLTLQKSRDGLEREKIGKLERFDVKYPALGFSEKPIQKWLKGKM